MERLRITNFLNIKEADIDVGKINLIIGPQASGKSIVAKLLYFFHSFLSSTYIYSINETNTQIKKRGLHEFKQYFPKYAWGEQEFAVIFQTNDIEVTVTHIKNKNGEATTSFDYSKNLMNLQRKFNLSYKEKKTEDDQEMNVAIEFMFKNDYVSKSEFSNSFRQSIFIPASRSFFASLQKNIFSFLANNVYIDPFIKSFGGHYERAKHLYNDLYLKDNLEEFTINKIKNLVEQILVGKYKHENEQDWIIIKDKKINLVNASSGQQEALPMLIAMSYFSILPYLFFVIEEPETHLFPVSQKHIISLIALLYSRRSDSFVITTHSPYILTAINNAIMASETAKEAGKEAVEKIMDMDYSIKYEDVRAYTIRDGVVESIMDEESRLIGASVIDSVSDEFDNVFDSLINLRTER